MRRQTILLGDQVFTVERWHSFSNATHVACGEALVCPRCAKVWAVLALEGEEEVWARSQSCGECRHRWDWCPVPGSLLVEEGYGVIDDSLLAALPFELVEREFKLHLEAYADD